MEKAYDLKELGKRLKEAGLAQTEETAEKVYDITMNWVEESASVSKTPLDDVVKIVRPYIDGLVKPQIDRISTEGEG